MPATLLAQAGTVFEARFLQPKGIGSPTAGMDHDRQNSDWAPQRVRCALQQPTFAQPSFSAASGHNRTWCLSV